MKLLLRRCSCNDAEYARIQRSSWMRLFPSRRLFQCKVCHVQIFALQAEINSMNWRLITDRLIASTTKSKQS
jgi:hypothetical protein